MKTFYDKFADCFIFHFSREVFAVIINLFKFILYDNIYTFKEDLFDAIFQRSGRDGMREKGPQARSCPIPEEGKWVQSKEIKDISGLTHGVGWCAPSAGVHVS